METVLAGIGLAPGEARGHLGTLFSPKSLAPGTVLFDHGDSAEVTYFVVSGHLAVHKQTGFFRKMQVIALLDSGAVVGEGALFGGRHLHSTRVTAIEESKVYGISSTDFRGFKAGFPDTAIQIIEYLLSIVSLRLEKTSERLARIL